MSYTSQSPGPRLGQSQIAWGPIVAGAFVALAVLVALSSLGTAIGLTVTQGEGPTSLANFVWMTIASFLALFAGGWAMSQGIARENGVEAVFYGVVLWGVMFLGLLLLGLAGVVTGFSVIMGVTGVIAPQPLSAMELAKLAADLGLSDEQLAAVLQAMRNAQETRNPVATGWWTLAGIFASFLASILGAVAGATPRLSIRGQAMGHHAFPDDGTLPQMDPAK